MMSTSRGIDSDQFSREPSLGSQQYLRRKLTLYCWQVRNRVGESDRAQAILDDGQPVGYVSADGLIGVVEKVGKGVGLPLWVPRRNVVEPGLIRVRTCFTAVKQDWLVSQPSQMVSGFSRPKTTEPVVPLISSQSRFLRPSDTWNITVVSTGFSSTT